MNYTCYGLTIACELALPELATNIGVQTDTPPDVSISVGQVCPDGLQQGRQLGPFLWASPNQLWLRVPDVARFLVSDGSTIMVAPEGGADEDSIRVFLLGSALGALLFQRGYLVLHGNAIRIGDQCMVCVGPSGAGKSTLAAGFMQRGYEVLADDVVPVDSECRALAGFPRIKLWQDTADKLQIDTGALRRIRPGVEKFNYPLKQNLTGQALPIRWVYILGSDHTDQIKFIPIQGFNRFLPLRRNTYRNRFLEGMSLKSEHLKLCSKLAGSIRIASVLRPKIGFDLDALVDHLVHDMSENP
jgi:hypothetical protein